MTHQTFINLTKEHDFFLKFLELKETNPSQFYDLNRWELFASILEKNHHEKEESFLFPYLIPTDALNAGGIKCATFFTPRVLSAGGWPDSYHELIKYLNLTTLMHEELNPFRKLIFDQKSMLMIPIEDHILGAIAIRQIFLRKNDHKLMNLFSALLKDHIEREEECLYPLCEKVLSNEQKNIFTERAKHFNDENHTDSALVKLLAP